MPRTNISFLLTSEQQTANFAARLAQVLSPGDTVLLTGEVGAGKTHFARAAIQSVLNVSEDVPSPTFTLVQTYDTKRGPLWHADLYRLGSVHEIEELGLTDSFETAICLIEWPDKLGDLRPETALEITLETGPTDTSRQMTASSSTQSWGDRLQWWLT